MLNFMRFRYLVDMESGLWEIVLHGMYYSLVTGLDKTLPFNWCLCHQPISQWHRHFFACIRAGGGLDSLSMFYDGFMM